MVHRPAHIARIYLYVTTACMSSAVMSVAAAWSSPALARLGAGSSGWLTRSQEVLVQAALPAFAVPGLFFGWLMAELWGRRPTLLLGGSLSVTGWVFLGMAPDFTSILIGRVINGLAIGFLNIGSALFLPEIASKDIQGMLFGVAQIFTNLGCLVEYGVGPFVPLWLLAGISSVWALAFTLFSFFLPESPYFLVARGDLKEAETVLLKLRGSKDVSDELDLIQERAGSGSGPWERAWCLWSEGRHLRGALVVCGACLLKQVTGGVAILSYAQPLFILSGVSLPSGLASLVLGSVKTLGSCFTACLARKFSLKRLLMVSCLGVACFLIILAAFLYFYEQKKVNVSYLNWVPLFCIIMYFVFLDVGIGPFPSFLGSETLEWKVRSAGVAISLTLSHIVTAATMTMVVTWYLPLALASFGLSALIAIPLLHFFMKNIHKSDSKDIIVTHL